MTERKFPYYESDSLPSTSAAFSGASVGESGPRANLWGKETKPAISRLSQQQVWNRDFSEPSKHESQSNFFLPSEFESLTIGEERASPSLNTSSLALAATRSVPSTIVGKAHSTRTFSSTGSSLYSNSPSNAARKQSKSSLSSALNNITVATMKIHSIPPGFHSPISITNSNQDHSKGVFRNHSHGGNASLKCTSKREGNVDNRTKQRSWQNHGGQKSQGEVYWQNGEPDVASGHSPRSYQSRSSVNYSIGNDWNRPNDDASHKSHFSNIKSGDSASSLSRYNQSGLHANNTNSRTVGHNYTGDSYAGKETQSLTAIQKMLGTSLMSKEGAQSRPAPPLPSLAISSFSDLDEQRSLPKKQDLDSLSFTLPPHLPVPREPTTWNGVDERSSEYDDGDMSRTSRSTVSTSYRSKGKNKDWRLKMNHILRETPVGEVDPNEIPICVLMNEWAKTQSSEGAEVVEKLLKRAEEEVKAGNVIIELTTKLYTIAIDAWAKSKEGGKAARRAETILQQMFELYKTAMYPKLKPTTGIFNAVVNSWAQSKDELAPARCEQILNWMEDLYRKGDHDVKPDSYTWNTVMHAHVQSGKKESLLKVRSFLDRMNIMYREGNTTAKPETMSYNIAINALAKCGKVGSASEAENLLSKMHTLYEMGDLDVKPNVVTYCTVIDAYAKSMSTGAAARGDALLANMIQHYQSDPVGNANLRPNTHVFNTVINCWSKSKDRDAASKAEEIFLAMEKLHDNGVPGLKPDAFTYTVLIDAWAKTGMRGAASRAEALLTQMENKFLAGDTELKPNSFTYNAVLNSLAKSGEPGAANKAERVLHNMVNRHKAGEINDVKPTTIHFNALLDAFAKSGGGRDAAERAEHILEWMDGLFKSGNADVKPDTITFNAVLDCWARSGDHRRAAERAEQILNHMDRLHTLGNTGIKADSYTYNTVINAWAKSGAKGAAQNAESVLQTMEIKYRQGDSSLKPNTRTYTSLIDCWAKSGEVNAAKKAEQIFFVMQAKYEQTGDNAAKPNTHSANAVMNACAFTTRKESKGEALAIAFRVFEWLLMQRDINSDAYTFTIMLSVCSNLLSRQDRETRYSHAHNLFMKCRESGHVNDFVLRKLRHTVTQEEYLSLVDYRVNSSANNLPPSWTRNARVGKSSNRGKKSKWKS